MHTQPWGLLGTAVLLAAACTGGAAGSAAPSNMPGPTSPPPSTAAPSGGGAAATTSPPPAVTAPPGTIAPPTIDPATLPLWQTAQLRDVRTGEFFSIAGLAPRLVVIEPMATWCTNCRAQQVAAREALATLNNPDIVYISLDVDSIENEADLAAYADGHSFPWRFAVASREVARSLAQEFGDVALAPPAVPSITVAPTGEVTFGFGHRDANQLVAELSALLP